MGHSSLLVALGVCVAALLSCVCVTEVQGALSLSGLAHVSGSQAGSTAMIWVADLGNGNVFTSTLPITESNNWLLTAANGKNGIVFVLMPDGVTLASYTFLAGTSVTTLNPWTQSLLAVPAYLGTIVGLEWDDASRALLAIGCNGASSVFALLYINPDSSFLFWQNLQLYVFQFQQDATATLVNLPSGYPLEVSGSDIGAVLLADGVPLMVGIDGSSATGTALDNMNNPVTQILLQNYSPTPNGRLVRINWNQNSHQADEKVALE
jgi:hypothetical protein